MASNSRGVNVVCVNVSDLLKSGAVEESKRLDRWSPNTEEETPESTEKKGPAVGPKRKETGKAGRVSGPKKVHPSARRSNGASEQFWVGGKVEGRIPHISPTDPTVLDATLRNPEPTLIKASQSVEGRSVNAWDDQPTSSFVAVPPSDPRRRSKRHSLVDMEVYKKMSRASSLVSSNRTVEEEEDTDEPLDVDALMEMAPKMSVFPPQTSLPKTLPEDNSMDGSKYPSTHSPVDARSTTALPQAMDESDTKGREIAMNILNQLEIYKQTVSARLGENRAEDAHPTRAQDAGDTTGGSHVAASLLKEKALSGKAASKPSGNSDWGEGVSAPTRQRKNFATLLREQTEAQRKGNGVSHLSNKPLPNTRVAPRNGLVLRNDPSGRPDSTRRLVPINFMNQEEQLPASRRPKKR